MDYKTRLALLILVGSVIVIGGSALWLVNKTSEHTRRLEKAIYELDIDQTTCVYECKETLCKSAERWEDYYYKCKRICNEECWKKTPKLKRDTEELCRLLDREDCDKGYMIYEHFQNTLRDRDKSIFRNQNDLNRSHREVIRDKMRWGGY